MGVRHALDNHTYCVAVGCSADLALQQWLGLLPQWYGGTGIDHHSDSDDDGKDIGMPS